jgi:hypothetical protein
MFGISKRATLAPSFLYSVHPSVKTTLDHIPRILSPLPPLNTQAEFLPTLYRMLFLCGERGREREGGGSYEKQTRKHRLADIRVFLFCGKDIFF